MKGLHILFSLCLAAVSATAVSGNVRANDESEHSKKCCKHEEVKPRLTIGGYGEATVTRNFYTDNFNRYNKPAEYKNKPGHTQFDLPHVVLMLEYDFGKGWSMGTEIEFEHGGTESAVELEGEEAGEWEKEIERGGEVALEQFWIEKAFSDRFKLRFGHMVVPVGNLNAHHLPTQFFTVLRPEGESTILPSTWHQTGVSVGGQLGKWNYTAMLMPGLNSALFSNQYWINRAAASPFEFTPGNKLAGAVRIDNTSVKGLRIGLSGYYGHSFNNTLGADFADKYKEVKGAVAIGAIDFDYKGYNWIVRGNFDYGTLSDAGAISDYNRNLSKTSPYKRTFVGKAAYAGGIEAGYNLFSQIKSRKEKGEQLYLFGRYEAYDTYQPAEGKMDYGWSDRQRVAVGLNYFPIRQVVIKAEYATRLFKTTYNNEPSLSFGVAYAGFFTK